MNEERIYQLMARIVAQEMTEEKEILQIEGRTIISDALSGNTKERSLRKLEEFEFGSAELLASVNILATIVATVKAILDIREKVSTREELRNSEAEYAKQWKMRLIEEGLAPDVAERISSTFVREMISTSMAEK